MMRYFLSVDGDNNLVCFDDAVVLDSIKAIAPEVVREDGTLNEITEEELSCIDPEYNMRSKKLAEDLYNYVVMEFEKSLMGGNYNRNLDSYTYTEEKTFKKQLEEAQAYSKSKSTKDCPNLIILSSIRSISLDVLVNKILTKHSQAINDKFKKLGYLQKYRDIINKNKNDYKELSKLNEDKSWVIF